MLPDQVSFHVDLRAIDIPLSHQHDDAALGKTEPASARSVRELHPEDAAKIEALKRWMF